MAEPGRFHQSTGEASMTKAKPPIDASKAELLAAIPEDKRREILAGWSAEELLALEHEWNFWARPGQIAPDRGEWRTWLILAGRGFGKTRAGAEWVRAHAEH